MMRYCISELVREDGRVLTRTTSEENYGPSYSVPSEYDPIMGPAYGRWRYSGENEWRITLYLPNGTSSLPQYYDVTGDGHFISVDPRDAEIKPAQSIVTKLRRVTT